MRLIKIVNCYCELCKLWCELRWLNIVMCDCDVLLWSAIVQCYCELLQWIATVMVLMNYYTEGRTREGQNPMIHLLLWCIIMNYYNETKGSEKREGHKKWTKPFVKRMWHEALIQGKDAVKQKVLIQGKDTNSEQNPMWKWSDKTLCEKSVTWSYDTREGHCETKGSDTREGRK